ncbi:MAG: hypothetical protein AB1586_33625 [Pseudomonadota bacterium]|jgi:hypothetical protein
MDRKTGWSFLSEVRRESLGAVARSVREDLRSPWLRLLLVGATVIAIGWVGFETYKLITTGLFSLKHGTGYEEAACRDHVDTCVSSVVWMYGIMFALLGIAGFAFIGRSDRSR